MTRAIIFSVTLLSWITVQIDAADPPAKKSSQRATVTEIDLRTGKQKNVGTFTFEQIWMQMVDRRIAAEIAGERPDPVGVKSWKEEWRQWYASLRRKSGVGFESTRFKTSEDLVRYIKQKRKAKGLPPYDP
jgi:hypothetical protein